MAETDEVEKEARQLGWTPKEEWKGNPEKWIDAKAFVERGQEIMPILRSNNKRLQQEVSELRGELGKVKELLVAGQEAMEALKEFNSSATLGEAKRTKEEIKEA